MNDEINKIIQSISDFYKLDNALKYYLDRHKAQILLDYITNLQKENEKLKKEKKKISQQHIYTLDKLIETQTKIENAIEYIKENEYIDLNGYDLLNILGGDDNES